jgi:hypothetical protein
MGSNEDLYAEIYGKNLSQLHQALISFYHDFIKSSLRIFEGLNSAYISAGQPYGPTNVGLFQWLTKLGNRAVELGYCTRQQIDDITYFQELTKEAAKHLR